MQIKPFNKKLQIFTYRLLTQQASANQNSKGMAMVFVLACGIIIVFLASIITLKSGDDSLASKIDKSNKQTQAITEAGVRHFLAEIMDSSARGVLLHDYDCKDSSTNTGWLGSDCVEDWEDTSIDITTYAGFNACASTAGDAVTELSSFDASGVRSVTLATGSAAGEYDFVAYRYEEQDDASTTNIVEGKGRLMLDGKKDNDSQSRLMAEFPVQIVTGGQSSIAGLIANNIELQKTDATTGAIICTDPTECPIDCTGNASGDDTSVDGNELYDALGSSYDSNGDPQAIIQHPDGTSDTEILVGKIDIPEVPDDWNTANVTINQLGVLLGNTNNNVDLGSTGIVLPRREEIHRELY